MRSAGELWIATWAAQETGEGLIQVEALKNQKTGFWIAGHAILAGFLVPVAVIRVMCFMRTVSRISQNTHDKMLSKILRAPVNTYFDVTPTGRILNRFSRDLDSMDMQLPIFMFGFLESALFIVSILVVACASSLAALIFMGPFIVLFMVARMFFSRSMRELKRMEGTSRSPLYSMFQETCTGLTHIRAFNMMQDFRTRYDNVASINFKVYFHQQAGPPWLAQRLNFLALLLVATIIFSSPSMPKFEGHAALVGFALSTTIGLLGRLIQTTIMSIETENHMTAVERMQHFEMIPQEALDEDSSKYVANWPSVGKIEFSDVHLCYRPGLPNVLCGLSFTIEAGQHVGIVGRTGCGKSSTMLALLRLVDVNAGSILIDGISTKEVPLQQLRSGAVSIIPQEPYLFEGSVRENLDPFLTQTDADLWEVLKRVSVADLVSSLGGLESNILEGAENISAGQRQLLCIARTLLRRSKIVLLDEATASIDGATDRLVQTTLSTCFVGCTSITIAHRLETILDSDRIICLNAGKVIEEGAPSTLLSDPESEVSRMAMHAGITKKQEPQADNEAVVHI